MPTSIHLPNGSMARYVNRGMSVLTAGQVAINPLRVAVSHAPDRHKADGGLNVLQDDERVASLDSGNL